MMSRVQQSKLYGKIQIAPDVLSFDIAGTYRAAPALGCSSGIDHSLPHMSFRTLPPDTAVAPRHDHLGCQVSVECGVPLGRYRGTASTQIIETDQDFF